MTTPPQQGWTFTQFLEQNSLIHEKPLSELKGQRIGIDGAFFVHRLQNYVREQEKFFALSAPSPYHLYTFLTQFFAPLNELDTSSIVVFDGMAIVDNSVPPHVGILGHNLYGQQGHPLLSFPKYAQMNNPTVLKGNYSVAGQTQEIRRELDRCLQTPYIDEDGEALIISALRFYAAPTSYNYKIEVCRAPYWAWNQMVAMVSPYNYYCNQLMGPPELLMYEDNPSVILDLDFQRGVYTTASHREVMECIRAQTTGCTVSDFVSAVLLSSDMRRFQEIQQKDPRFGALQYTPIARQIASSFVELVSKMQNAKLAELLEPYQTPPDTYNIRGINVFHARLLRFRAAVIYGPILTGNVECLQLSKLNGKPTISNAGDLCGQMLTPLLYYLLYRGFLSPSIAFAVANSKIVDFSPLAATTDYTETSKRIIPLRTQIIHQILQDIPSQSPHSPIVWRSVGLQQPKQEIQLVPPPSIKLDEWTELHKVNTPLEDGSFPLINFFHVLQFAANARSGPILYTDVRQALAAIHLKALDLLGYFTHATHTNTAESSGKSVYSEALEKIQPLWAEYGVLLIELLRTRALHDNPFTFIGTPMTTSSPLPQGFYLAARLVSFVPMTVNEPWNSDVVPHLLAFNSIARSLHRSLRTLIEVITAGLFMEEKNRFDIAEYDTIREALPFQYPPACYAGIVILWLLSQGWVVDFNQPAHERSEVAWEKLNEKFPSFGDLPAQLWSVFIFWMEAKKVMDWLSQPQSEHEILDPPTNQAARKVHPMMLGLAKLLYPSYEEHLRPYQ